MAQRRYTLLFSTAIFVALVATYGVYQVLEQSKRGTQIPTQSVVVASRDVPEGQRFDRLALSVNQWPTGTVPPGAFPSADSVVGRVARVAVFKGEPIVPGRLAPPGTGPGLEVKITPGKRAMAIRINDVVGLAGLIQPNSRVDVLVMFPDAARAGRQAKLFMSNMRVLSVGTNVERGQDGKAIEATTAALEVTPEEAERLAVAESQGGIQLVLRGYGDPDNVNTKGATASDVLAQLRDAPVRTVPAPRRIAARPTPPSVVLSPVIQNVAPAPRKEEPHVVEVYRAGKLSEQKFVKEDSAATPSTP
jgi:pilus assembly protein CpaB